MIKIHSFIKFPNTYKLSKIVDFLYGLRPSPTPKKPSTFFEHFLGRFILMHFVTVILNLATFKTIEYKKKKSFLFFNRWLTKIGNILLNLS